MAWGWIRGVGAGFGEGRGLVGRHLWICYRCRVLFMHGRVGYGFW